ncbi:hypothetical protein H6A66_05455 [Bacteroides caecigallinarum]|uniref:hypothetical protein n=1 Tax=Bacteroides caecigallinarum TaxID=1411144 RepID=UPI00195C9B85|nr:hypothetical protein [Bacteroides caecigallinarum]MBM6864616.1 hypothetical protein [Bacteroides caecigallinarum]
MIDYCADKIRPLLSALSWQPRVMIAMVDVGHLIRMFRQVKSPVPILPFGQNSAGGIEQGCQKDI